jgi:hypothetical protein
LKNRTKAFVDIFMDRFGRGLGALILMGYSALLETDPRHPNLKRLSAVIFCISVLWFLLSARVGKEYLAETRLAAVAVDAARSAGIAGALTGPVVRNDKHTLAAQLAALHALDPAAAEAHRALSAKLVDVAEAAGRLDRRQARGLARVLGRGPGRPPTV